MEIKVIPKPQQKKGVYKSVTVLCSCRVNVNESLTG